MKRQRLVHARTQKRHQSVEEHTWRETGPPNSRRMRGKPRLVRAGRLQRSEPPRGHVLSTARPSGLCVGSTRQPRITRGPQIGLVSHSTGSSPPSLLGPSPSLSLLHGPGSRCPLNAAEYARRPRAARTVVRPIDIPWPKIPIGHRPPRWEGSPPAPFIEGPPPPRGIPPSGFPTGRHPSYGCAGPIPRRHSGRI